MASPELEAPKSQSHLRELDYRYNHGVEVRLLWNSDTDAVLVEVVDERTGVHFEVNADRDNAREVFEHPYAYTTYSRLGELASGEYGYEAA
jgi:hypothetical protein